MATDGSDMDGVARVLGLFYAEKCRGIYVKKS